MLPACLPPSLRARSLSRLARLAHHHLSSQDKEAAPWQGEQANRGGEEASTSGRCGGAAASAWQHLPLRGFASDAAPQEPPKEAPTHPPLSQDVLYLGPLSKTHKLLKRISIANTAIALAAAPAIMWYADISYASRVGLATTLVLFGIITTGALHWITHPYVHELRYTAATQSFEARMTTLFGRTRIQHFKLSDVQPLPWDRPVATFMANGQFYYIDVYSFPDEELLKRLTPPEDSVPPGYQDDKDDD